MGYFDDIVPPDSASSYFPTPPGVPRITVQPSSDQLDDMPGEVGLAPNQVEPWGTGEGPIGKVAPSPRIAGWFDDIVAPAAQHKAAIERALSTTVPLRLQHPRAVEIASGLMADQGRSQLPTDQEQPMIRLGLLKNRLNRPFTWTQTGTPKRQAMPKMRRTAAHQIS